MNMRAVYWAALGLLVLTGCDRGPPDKGEALRPAPAPDAAAPASLGEVAPGIPRLPERATLAKAFVPAGWTLEYETTGDINRDGLADLVMVLHGTDPKLIITHDGMGENPYDSNPRILAIALGEAGGFRLVAQDHELIPRRDSPTLDEPIQQAPVIDKGTLSVGLSLFMSAGGADAGTYTFRFRYEDGEVLLIGYDRDMTHRMSGKTDQVSINFLTGTRVDSTGSIEVDHVDRKPSRINVEPMPLREVGDGYLFEQDKLKP